MEVKEISCINAGEFQYVGMLLPKEFQQVVMRLCVQHSTIVS
jgi:hypothetical protein